MVSKKNASDAIAKRAAPSEPMDLQLDLPSPVPAERVANLPKNAGEYHAKETKKPARVAKLIHLQPKVISLIKRYVLDWNESGKPRMNESDLAEAAIIEYLKRHKILQ